MLGYLVLWSILRKPPPNCENISKDWMSLTPLVKNTKYFSVILMPFEILFLVCPLSFGPLPHPFLISLQPLSALFLLLLKLLAVLASAISLYHLRLIALSYLSPRPPL